MPIISHIAGGGGGGATTYTDTYANIPAAGNAGDLFFPTDGVCVYYDNGAEWVPYGPVFPATEPPTAGWSWVNQGAAVVDATMDGISLYMGNGSNNWNLRCYVRSIPSVPYTVTTRFLGTVHIVDSNGAAGGGGDYPAWGLVWRESGTGELVALVFISQSIVASMHLYKFNSPTSYSAGYKTLYVPITTTQLPTWVRFEDDNTDRVVSLSMDGLRWFEFYRVGRTDFLTADQIGIWVNSYTNPASTSIRLTSWKES